MCDRGRETMAIEIIPPTDVVNKILLEHSDAHWFTCCLWLLLPYNNRGEQLGQKPHGLQSQKYLLSSTLERKFANPSFKQTNYLTSLHLNFLNL